MAVQINVAANQAALVASIQAGVQAYNQRFANNNQINLSINARAFSQPLGRITGDVKDFEAALAASNARVIAFGASTAVLGGVIRSFKELATVTIEVEKNLADINRVFGLTTSQLQKFSTDLFNVTKQTASTFDEASKAALEFSRQGLKAEDTLQRTKDALTLTRLAGISTANAVDALTSTVNGFAATGVTTSQILNKLVAVEQDFAVGAGDLAEALSRTGQAAQEAGVSLDELNALVTSAQQSTARGGAVIGNALKTIFTRLQRSETLDQLEAFNIAVRDVQGNILPAVTILQNFAGAYKGLADAQRAQLSEQVAGVYQVNILKAIVNDLNKSQGVYAGALQRGASATNEAEMATAKLNQTLDALLSQTATSAQQLANNIGKVTFEPLARYGTEQLKSLVESMNEILEGEGIGSTFANGLLKGIRNVIAGPGAIAAFFTLFKLIQNSFSFLTQALPQIAGITTETQNRKNIEQSILQIMQQQGPVSQALAGTMGNQAAQAQLLLQLARQQTAEYQQQSALAKQLATQLAGQGVRVKGSAGLQVTRAGGYVPTATKLAEVVGAKAGGYTPGAVVPSPVGGVMNTAEDVRYIPGFAQPFINPPANSKAGRAHRQNAISRTGVDPYMAGGFIPNFAKGVDLGARGKEFEKLVNFYLINEKTTAGTALLDFPHPSNSLTEATLKDKNKISLNPLSIYGDAKIKSSKDTQRDLVKKLVGSLDSATYGKLITRANKIKSDTINLNDFLPSKPSLISSKSSITKDNLNASIDAQLGPDVIENLQRLLKDKKNTNRLTTDSWYKNLKLSFIDDYVTIPNFSNSGFIPNFAPPTSAMRIPWFKKFANPVYDNIQPTLGISKASDVDTFRQTQFRSTAKNADKQGDPNIFGSLYEVFGRRALQLVNQSNIFGELVAGSVLQPGAIRDQTAFDAGFLQKAGIVGVDYKGFPKINLSGGSVAKHMTDKYNRVAKTNPEQAAKIKEAIMIFNEPGNQNQLPSVFGKNFIQLAGTSYSEMLKNTPNFVKELSNETNMLLDKYVKNPQFLRMNAASGFIPNFAYKQAVIGLEESMSGEKAIFDTKPFPHIRNSSQPTFSSAIADHGGLGNALSDSMRGQKAAGLMNDGFIPNFANSRSARRRIQRNQQSQQTNNTGGTASFNPQQIASQAEKLAQDALRKINNAYQYIAVFGADFADIIENASKSATAQLKTSSANVKTSVGNLSNNLKLSFGGMFGKGQSSGGSKPPVMSSGPNVGMFSKIGGGLSKAFANPVLAMIMPQIAGAVGSQFAYGDKKRYELTESERKKQSFANTGITSISTGAFIGNMILPGWGAAIGAAVGGLIAFSEATKAAKLSIGEMQEKISETNAKQTNAITDYKNNLEQLALATESGDEISKSKYTRDLATSFSGLSSQNLKAITEGKSVKELDILISDMNKKAATQTAILSASEKLTKGGKEVSFFDKFKQQAGEAILDFGNMTVDAFTTLGTAIVDGFKYIVKSTSTIFTTIVDRIKDPFFNFIDGLKSSFTSLSDYLGSSLRMIILGFKQQFLDIQNFFGFGDAEKQQQLDSDILAANTVYEEASQKLQDSIMNGLKKGIDLGLQGLDIGKYVAKSFASLSLVGMAANMAIESGPRKIQNYKMSDVASEYLKLSGGADISGFFKKIFKPDDELFGLIQTVGKSGATKDRESALNQIRSILIDRGVEGNDIDTLITSIRELGQTGNFKGQFILNDFKKFLDELDASQESSKKAAARMAATFGDFVSLKQKIERDINDYLNQSRLGEVGITAQIQRRKISLEEQSRMSEFFGKPFQSAQYRDQSARLDIDREFQQAQRDQVNQSMAMIADLNKKLNNTSISSLETLEQSLISENLTLEERLQKIKEFVEKSDTSFINPLDRQNFKEQIKAANTTYNLSKEKNKEDIKTADYVYSLEIKRLQEARNFRLQLKSGLSSLSDEGNLMIGKLGRDLPGMFADGMVNGIKAAIRESDNLGDALMGVAANFLDSISTTLMQAGTRQILGSFGFENLFKAQKGGVIRAQSGMYISGTGTGDKYPALLENGEYVLNRRAVMAMGGPAALDTLNFSMAPRFASGGSFNAELSDIKAMEEGMTTFGLENSSLYKELRDEEIRKAEEARQKKRARQAQTAQMVGSLVASVAAVGIGAGLQNMAGNMQAKAAEKMVQSGTGAIASAGLSTYKDTPQLYAETGLSKAEVSSFQKLVSSGYISPSGMSTIKTPRTGFGSILPPKVRGRQTGGLIGSRLSDTIPGYMEGGLYNSPMVKKYGTGMQAGGMSPVANNNSNTVNNNNANNAFNFNTTVNRDGTIQMGANSTSYKQQDVELSNNLNNRIYGAVLDVIRDQQRFGGSLAGTRKA